MSKELKFSLVKSFISYVGWLGPEMGSNICILLYLNTIFEYLYLKVTRYEYLYLYLNISKVFQKTSNTSKYL